MNSSSQEIPLFVKILLPLVLLIVLSPLPFHSSLPVAWANYRLAVSQNEPEAAVEALETVVDVQPWRAEIWERLGQAEYAQGHWQASIDAFEQAAGYEILTAEGRLALGRAYEQTGQNEAALSSYSQLFDLNNASTQTAEALQSAAELARRQGDYDRALQFTERWIALEPETLAPYQLSAELAAVIDPELARERLDEAVRLDPAVGPALQPLRSALVLARNSEHSGYGWVMIGRALANQADWDLAEEAFKSSTRQEPDYAEGWAFLGEAVQHREDAGEAAGWAELEKAAGLDPNSVVVQAFKGAYWGRHDRPDLALVYLHGAAALEPEQAIWQMEMGNMLQRMGDALAAIRHYQKAIELDPDDPETYAALARCSFNSGFELRAIGLPAARQALRLDPQEARYSYLVGTMLYELGDLESSERFLQQAVDRDHRFAAAYLRLGQLYLQVDKIAEARSSLMTAAQFESTDPESAQTAQEWLKRFIGNE